LPTIAGASKRAKLVRWGGETAVGAGTVAQMKKKRRTLIRRFVLWPAAGGRFL